MDLGTLRGRDNRTKPLTGSGLEILQMETQAWRRSEVCPRPHSKTVVRLA